MPWLRLFRVVNLPTVPGDVLAGAAYWMWVLGRAGRYDVSLGCALAAGLASVFMYMFGLADNDIVGAKYDKGRPIPDGEISLGAARIARGLCLFAVLVTGAVANLPPSWWIVAFVLMLICVAYNRTKKPVLMGVCRALDVECGMAAAQQTSAAPAAHAFISGLSEIALPLVWFVFFAAVTKYSEGEEDDPARKRRVGVLIGAVVYLQLAVLAACTAANPSLSPLLVSGVAMLVLLWGLKFALPKVSAS
ncbi:MAG: UbiA family prenyltransferase [Kiritimatiellae bacterium]|nr:UbiA family prenyltransferase [Kiritimatiellia bacterium]